MSYSHLSMLSSFLILLLLDRTQANAVRTRPKRDLSDSFAVKIGAGYGVGVDQSSTSLPKSTATVTSSTNTRLHRILSEETVQADDDHNYRKPRMMIRQREPQEISFGPAHDIVTSRPDVADAWSKLVTKPVQPKVMNMKEIQNVLHDLDNSSEYSKVIQVVKVPAIYEIHVEKSQQKSKAKPAGQNHNHPVPQQVMVPILKHHFTHRGVAPNIPATYKNRGPLGYYNRPRLGPHPQLLSTPRPLIRGKNLFGILPANSYSTLASSALFDVRPASASMRRVAAPFHNGEDYIYGRQVERVSSPDEMNITVQPGATMVTFPRKERFVERSFPGDGGQCDTNGGLHRRVDGVFITTNRPVYPPRIARRLFSGSRDGSAVKYYIVINKKFVDDDDDDRK